MNEDKECNHNYQELNRNNSRKVYQCQKCGDVYTQLHSGNQVEGYHLKNSYNEKI